MKPVRVWAYVTREGKMLGSVWKHKPPRYNVAMGWRIARVEIREVTKQKAVKRGK